VLCRWSLPLCVERCVSVVKPQCSVRLMSQKLLSTLLPWRSCSSSEEQRESRRIRVFRRVFRYGLDTMATMTPTTARERRSSSMLSGVQLLETKSTLGALEGAPAAGSTGKEQRSTPRRPDHGRPRAIRGGRRSGASGTAEYAAGSSGSIGSLEGSAADRAAAEHPSWDASAGQRGRGRGSYDGSCEPAYPAAGYANGAGTQGTGNEIRQGTRQAGQQLAAGRPQAAPRRVVDSCSSLSPRATALFAHGPTGTPTGTMSLRTRQLTRYSNLLLLATCIVIQQHARYSYTHMQHGPGACQLTWYPCSGWRDKKVSSTGAAMHADDRMFTPAACLFTAVRVTETIAEWPRGEICHKCKIKSKSDRKTFRNWRPAKKVVTSSRDRARHWHTRNWLALCHRLAWMLESSGGTYA
jgi:hypothetical protein